jgi:transcriptional regulator with XRE-family HTH domain
VPSINREAKAFETTLASWFAFAVRTRRNALKLTASELSRRTAELGYPITRGAISKIETEVRSGKIDVAEVLVLAAALDIPPVLMLFPNFSTDGAHQVLPGVSVRNEDAVRWLAGRISFPQREEPVSRRLEGQPHPPNEGVKLIAATASLEQALEDRIPLVNELQKAEADWDDIQANWDAAQANLDDVNAKWDKRETARRMLQINDEQIAAIRKQIRDAREALWGMRRDEDEHEGPEPESDD